MIVLFVLGLFGVKAALIVWVIYLIAKKMTQKGDAIKQGYEDRIEEAEEENRRLARELSRSRRREAQKREEESVSIPKPFNQKGADA